MQKLFRNLVLALVLSLVSVAAFAAPVDINTASAEQIAEALVGVGDSKAEAIIAFRKQHGPFKTVDDLMMVKGIGEKTLEKNRANIMVKAGKTK
jgi:competence protein ComEA